MTPKSNESCDPYLQTYTASYGIQRTGRRLRTIGERQTADSVVTTRTMWQVIDDLRDRQSWPFGSVVNDSTREQLEIMHSRVYSSAPNYRPEPD